MNSVMIMAKIAALHLYHTYGKIYSVNQILSRGKEKLDVEGKELLDKEKVFLGNLSKRIQIRDNSLTAKGIYKDLMDYSEKHGKWDKSGDIYKYIPNDDYYTIVIIDHIGLLSTRDGGIKQQIDEAANVLIWFRNKCGYTPVVLQQLNRDGTSSARRQTGFNEQIQLSDFKDSGTTQEAAEIIMGIFNPFKERMTNFRGYDITRLKDSFRAIQLIKNRYGEADRSVGFAYRGKVGDFNELPLSKDMMNDHYNEIINYGKGSSNKRRSQEYSIG